MSKIKGILSLCLAAAFLISTLSGLALWIWKGGMVLGIARWIISGIHEWSSVAMCARIIVHFRRNVKALRRELKAGRKKDGGQ